MKRTITLLASVLALTIVGCERPGTGEIEPEQGYEQEYEQGAQPGQGKPDEPGVGATGDDLQGSDLEPGGTTGTVEPGGTAGTMEPGGTTGTMEPGDTTGTMEPGDTTGTMEPGDTTGGIDEEEDEQFGPRTDPTRFGQDDDDLGDRF